MAANLQSVTEIFISLNRVRSWSAEADGVHKLRVRLLGTNYHEDFLDARILRETCDDLNTWYIKPKRAIHVVRDRSGMVVDTVHEDLASGLDADRVTASYRQMDKSYEYMTKRVSMYYSEGSLNEEAIDTMLVYQVCLPYPSWHGYFCLLIDLCVQIMPVTLI